MPSPVLRAVRAAARAALAVPICVLLASPGAAAAAPSAHAAASRTVVAPSAHAGASRTVARALAAPASAVAAPAPSLLPPGLPAYAAFLSLWDPGAGAYASSSENQPPNHDTRVSALALELHVSAALTGTPAGFVDPARVNALVDRLTQAPAFVDGTVTPYKNTDASQAHVPGFTSIAVPGDLGGFQHVAIDPEVALALAHAVANAAAVGLADDLRDRARAVVLRVASGPMFAPTQIRQSQLVWTADMLWAKYLVDGDRAAFVAAYRATLDSERKHLPGLLSHRFSYHYSGGRPGRRADRMDSPEYSFITYMGAAYIPQARAWGMPMRKGELAVYRGWAHRLVWGELANSGYLNWDTGMGQHRRNVTQYWGWTMLSLQRLTQLSPGLLSVADARRAAALCVRAQSFFVRQLGLHGSTALPGAMFGTMNDLVGEDPDLGTGRLLLALTQCSSPGPAPAAGVQSAYSYDPAHGRYAVTTSRYATSVVTYALGAISGLLPDKLLDGDGNPIGGLGGPTTGLDFLTPGFSLNSGLNQRRAFRLHAQPGTGRLTAGARRLTGVLRRGKQTARATLRFDREEISVTVRLARAAAGRWRIPLPPGTVRTVRHGGRTTLEVVPQTGAAWSARFPGRLHVQTVAATPDPVDPTVSQLALVSVPRQHRIRMTIAVGPPPSATAATPTQSGS